MKINLDQIESRLKQIFELRSDTNRFDEQIASLSRQLIEIISQSMQQDEGGQSKAAYSYEILLSPGTYSNWQSRPELVEVLASIVHEAIIDNGIHMPVQPVFHLEAEPSFSDTDLRIITFKHTDTSPKTAIMKSRKKSQEKSTPHELPKAFLLGDDGQSYFLDHPVINIGRRRENQIVIQDRHISREHAQIRMIQGHFVLFDLNATGGTYINGRRISQQILQSGDVISLAGYPLIYSEETDIDGGLPQQSGITKTTKIESPGEDEDYE
jgi:hypothetical protein